ncbi:MAG: glycosyltransferase family 2 protein [Bacteroidota bacterium]|nr:glycosyltransferase family 2 protein [Bacteroidota bacterium]
MAEETPDQAPESSPEQPKNNPKRENPFRRKNFRGKYPRPQRKTESEFPSLEKVEELPASIFPEIAEEKQTQVQPQQPKHQPRQPQQPRPQKQPQLPQQSPSRNPLVSVVIPLLNEEESLRELHEQLKNVLSRIGGNYELIFVDDGSTDNSFKVLRDLRQRNNRVKAIRFRRNYGKSAALAVGFQKAQGDFVVTMDADLQDDPAEIPNIIRELKGGLDVVSGWKKKRKDPLGKTIPSKFFNFVTAKVTGIKIHDFNCGLKGYRNDVIKSVNVYGELHRYIPALAHWLGFKVGETVVNHRPRKFGKTKFGMTRYSRGFLDLLTVVFTTRYVSRPLHLFGGWGIFSSIIGLAISLWLVYEKYFNDQPLSNRPLFIVALIMIIVGVQFVSMGLLGELITRNQQMQREYSIREEIN